MRKIESFYDTNNSDLTEKEKLKLIKKRYFSVNSSDCIPIALFGRCSFFDGVYGFSFEHFDDDFYVSLPYTEISRRELKLLQKLAKHQHKELFVQFNCTPKGPGSIVLTFILSGITNGILQEIGKDLYNSFKDCVINKISINKQSNNSATFEVVSDNEFESPTQIYLQDADEKQQGEFEKILVNNLVGNKIQSYNNNGVLYEKQKKVKLI